MAEIVDYYRASSIADLWSALGRLENARVIAGGTDLLLKLPRDETPSTSLVDITGIGELRGIKATDQGLRIGATTKMMELARSSLIRDNLEMLAQGAAAVGSPQIRHLATIGGNICNASPAADTAAPLLALDARAEITSAGGTRILPLKDFWVGPGQTVLAEHEILSAVIIPLPADGAKGMYLKHAIRGAMDLPIVGVAILLWREDGAWKTRISLSAVAPTPIRAVLAEEVFHSATDMDQQAIASLSEVASREANPITDIRASAAYRREMTRIGVQKIMNQLCAVQS